MSLTPASDLQEQAIRARRLAALFAHDPAAPRLEHTPKNWKPRSLGCPGAHSGGVKRPVSVASPRLIGTA